MVSFLLSGDFPQPTKSARAAKSEAMRFISNWMAGNVSSGAPRGKMFWNRSEGEGHDQERASENAGQFAGHIHEARDAREAVAEDGQSSHAKQGPVHRAD